MKIELIAIGNELLSGVTVNTNGSFIGKKLFEAGFSMNLQTIVPDDFSFLQDTLKVALKRSDVVITTGGLGPTIDDITKDAVIDLLDLKTSLSQEILEDLERRFGKDLPSITEQATVPMTAYVLKNSVGTAPGLILDAMGSLLILLPGVPKEMELLLINEVIPYLIDHFEQKKMIAETIHLYGLSEPLVDPLLRQLQAEHLDLIFGIYPGEGKLTVVIKANDRTALNICSDAIKKEFAAHLFASQVAIEKAIYEEFTKRKLTLSVAESCTGGTIAAKLTTIAGASNYFLGGVIPYSNALKTKWLSVPFEILMNNGAVSKECVYEMAKSLLEMTKSDYSLAVSGIAGPSGGTHEKPVGTVFGAIGCQLTGEIKTFSFFIPGNRHTVIQSTTNQMLFELYKTL